MSLIAKKLVSVQPLGAPSNMLHYMDTIYGNEYNAYSFRPYSTTHLDGTIVLNIKKKRINDKVIMQEEDTHFSIEYIRKQIMNS